jgi:hypothetical protein
VIFNNENFKTDYSNFVSAALQKKTPVIELDSYYELMVQGGLLVVVMVRFQVFASLHL